ncbi:MAG: helix-hairpin-helix domain-containing protein [Verrucomicrobiota bacterium]
MKVCTPLLSLLPGLFRSFGGLYPKVVGGIAIATVLALSEAKSAPLEAYEGCGLVATDWSDGDSFLVRFPDGKERVVRLYFVDCIETSATHSSDKRRIREQARYFGVEDLREIVAAGREATNRTTQLLSEPFTVITAFAQAPGRSGKPRYYAMVTSGEGVDLAAHLISAGLARAQGVGRATIDGIHRDDVEAYFDDLELRAALNHSGIWAHSDPDKIVTMRKQEREEARALEAVADALLVAPPTDPIDLNSASLEELMKAGLRESLADATIRMRPFKSVDDLIDVRGIGPVTLEQVRPYLRVSEPSD